STEEVAELEANEDEICRTLTGNIVKKWPRKDKLSSTKLTAKYALLNKIVVVNWVPTTHSSDVATGLSILVKGDIPCTRKSTLSLDHRLKALDENKFKVDHVIQALELEENPEAVVAEQKEEEDVAAANSDAGDEDE
ncbi:envelope-like protein, partial [Trifolium medium]|nr:envelope-like protein [Trifolium medium]